MTDQWYNEGGYIPPQSEVYNDNDEPETVIPARPGFWVIYFVGVEKFSIQGIFSSLGKAYLSMINYYKPKNLRVRSYSWTNELVEVRVFGKDFDGVRDLDMHFFIEYKRLDEFGD